MILQVMESKGPRVFWAVAHLEVLPTGSFRRFFCDDLLMEERRSPARRSPTWDGAKKTRRK